MNNQHLPMVRNRNVVVQQTENEVLIYDLNKDQAFCLNETAGLIWNACNGQRTVPEIASLLKLDNDDVVWLALDQLKQNDLLENGHKLVNKFQGLSRREVVRKIGLATMIALPIIHSVIAPTAVAAQSCVAAGNPCIATSDCCNSTVFFCISIGGSPICFAPL